MRAFLPLPAPVRPEPRGLLLPAADSAASALRLRTPPAIPCTPEPCPVPEAEAEPAADAAAAMLSEPPPAEQPPEPEAEAPASFAVM